MPFQLSEELVDKLLDKLSSDNEFRTAFQKSPRIALAYLGHDAAAKAGSGEEGAWMCMKCEKLASPEAIKASRDELRKQLLSSKAQYNPIKLQA
jgi:putative modified peptide